MKKRQRSKAQAECASSAKRILSWKDIDFSKCERKVRKQQVRIAKTQKEGRYNKVKALQHLLVTSFEAKVLAVRSQKRFTGKLHEVIFKRNKAVIQQDLIEQLNPVLRGWGNYYSHVVSKEVFSRTDHILVNQLIRWSYRRHSNKSRTWIKDKYFIEDGKRDWIFGFKYEDNGKKVSLH